MAANDCASGQVCGGDRFCASPELAGHCASLPTDDGGTPIPIRDAAVPDAEAIVTPDAPTTRTLHVHVDGQGGVSVLGVGICDSAPPGKGDCIYDLLFDTPLRAEAYPHADWRFDKWTEGPCNDGESRTCDFTPVDGATNITAKFRKNN